MRIQAPQPHKVIYSNPVAMRATPKATGRLVGQLHPGLAGMTGWLDDRFFFFWDLHGICNTTTKMWCDPMENFQGMTKMWFPSNGKLQWMIDSWGFLSNISIEVESKMSRLPRCDNAPHAIFWNASGDVAYCNEKQRSGDWLKVEEAQVFSFQFAGGTHPQCTVDGQILHQLISRLSHYL